MFGDEKSAQSSLKSDSKAASGKSSKKDDNSILDDESNSLTEIEK